MMLSQVQSAMCFLLLFKDLALSNAWHTFLDLQYHDNALCAPRVALGRP